MKALVYTGPERLEIQDVDAPRAGDGEVLIDIEACGICGSDMHAWHGHDERRPAPLILGHEAVGTIARGPRIGERVAVNPLVTCQTCDFCTSGRDNLCPDRQIISMPPRQGAFAAQIAMPERNLIAVPANIDPIHAALCEPIACGWHAVRLAGEASSRTLADCRTLVLGGGAIGLGAALVLKMRGAKEIWIAETNAARHVALNSAGEFRVFNPLTDNGPEAGSMDIVIDAVGFAATRRAACAHVRSGGVIMHIGLGEAEGGIDVRRLTLQEITFIGTYTYTSADFVDTGRALFAGRLGKLDWIEVRGLDEGPSAFADIHSARATAPKIILRP